MKIYKRVNVHRLNSMSNKRGFARKTFLAISMAYPGMNPLPFLFGGLFLGLTCFMVQFDNGGNAAAAAATATDGPVNSNILDLLMQTNSQVRVIRWQLYRQLRHNLNDEINIQPLLENIENIRNNINILNDLFPFQSGNERVRTIIHSFNRFLALTNNQVITEENFLTAIEPLDIANGHLLEIIKILKPDYYEASTTSDNIENSGNL